MDVVERQEEGEGRGSELTIPKREEKNSDPDALADSLPRRGAGSRLSGDPSQPELGRLFGKQAVYARGG
jgi:hypothetical protein